MTTNYISVSSLSTMGTSAEFESGTSTIDVWASNTTTSNIDITTTSKSVNMDVQTAFIVALVGGFSLIIIAAILLLVWLYFCRSRKQRRIRRTRSHLLPNQSPSLSDLRTSIGKDTRPMEVPYWVSQVDQLYLKTYNPYYHNYTYFGRGIRSNRPNKNLIYEP